MNLRLPLTVVGLIFVPVLALAQTPPPPPADGPGVAQLTPPGADGAIEGNAVAPADSPAGADAASLDTVDGVHAYLAGTWYADLNGVVAEAMRDGWNAGWAADAFRALGGSSYARVTLAANGTGSGSANVVGMAFADSGSFSVSSVDGDRAQVTMTAPAYNTTTSGSIAIEGPDSFVLNAMGYRLRFSRQ